MDNLFIGTFSTGISYCDRSRMEDGDYKHIAFLDYRTLTLTWRSQAPAAMRTAIKTHAATIQARRGEQYEISSCGQTVRLGA